MAHHVARTPEGYTHSVVYESSASLHIQKQKKKLRYTIFFIKSIFVLRQVLFNNSIFIMFFLVMQVLLEKENVKLL